MVFKRADFWFVFCCCGKHLLRDARFVKQCFTSALKALEIVSFYILSWVPVLLNMVCFITKRRLTNFRMNCAWNYEGYSLGQIFSVVFVCFCQGITSRLTTLFQIVVCEHKLREMFGFLVFWVFFFTDIELHHCKIWIPSLLALVGMMFSLYVLKNAFTIYWC